MDEEVTNRFDDIELQLEKIETHFNARLDSIQTLLLQLQSDLRMFYRELGYTDARLDRLEKGGN